MFLLRPLLLSHFRLDCHSIIGSVFDLMCIYVSYTYTSSESLPNWIITRRHKTALDLTYDVGLRKTDEIK